MKMRKLRLKDNPDIGVVMPIYKQIPKYLQLALSSILNQSYRNYQLIIVLDGAPSEVINLVAELTRNDQRVRVINNKENKGVSNALNTGFELLYKNPTIKYLTWVSSDNIHYYRMLEKLRHGFISSNNSRLGLVYSSFWHIDDKGERIYKDTPTEAFMEYQDQPKDKLLDYCFIGTSFMYRKDIAQAIKGYYLEPVEDYDFWLRYTENCELKFIKDKLMEYRVNSPHSISNQLKSSTQEQRRWRNSMNLARYQARNRRKIPSDLTVIIPLHTSTSIDIGRYERLLEQYYNNFVVLFIDNSNNEKAINLLKQIPDPRIKIIRPNRATKLNSLVLYALPYVTTPYVTVFNENSNHYNDQYYLENIISQEKFNKMTFQKGDVYISSDLKRIVGG